MSTYHSDFIRRYTRLSAILEMDSLIAQHLLREAFSDEEVKEAKARQDQVAEFQAVSIQSIFMDEMQKMFPFQSSIGIDHLNPF